MSTIAELVLARAEDDNVALVLDDRSWTWREVVAESQVRAAWLRSTLDPAKPPNVGVLLGNSPDYVFLLFGAALARACIVGANPTRRGAELTRDLTHTDCQLVITERSQQELLEVPSLLIEDAPWAGAADGGGTTPEAGDLWLLIFTSGSTSAPKAVRKSQGYMAGNAGIGFRSTDVLYCAMPLFHGNALSASLLPGLAGGARIVLREKFSASRWLSDVRTHGVTFANTVGRALGYVLATPPTDHDRDHHLKVVLAPESSPRDAADFTARFGCRVISGYGQSEGAIILLPVAKEGALGKAQPGSDLAVVDPETFQEKPLAELDEGGRLLNATDAIGELVRRDATSSFEGYWRNPEAEAERLRNGWYWSGDLAYLDGDGVFWFAGRAGDWLRVDSENFSSAPVERILGRMPAITAVAVVGVPDPQGGDQVLAVIEGSFDPEAFSTFLAEQTDLGTKWAPRFVRLTPQLPVTGTDKINKRPIKAQAWLTSDPMWWKPAGSTSYKPFTDDDKVLLRKEFEQHGRLAAHPQEQA
jgi:fatty-acyl-CoA synthase